LRAIAMLTALPYWFQEHLVKTKATWDIEDGIVKPFMAQVEGLIDQYDSLPGLRLEW